MVKKGYQRPVWFNKEHLKLHKELNTAQDFPSFVKDAFYDKVDRLRVERGLQ